MSVHLVIMAGGSGTRFWPKSTSKKPKQLLKFGSDKTLIQETLERFKGIADQSWVVTTEFLVDAIRAELGSQVTILAEPQARNTAPCVFWASKKISEQDPKAILLFMPADHYIRDVQAFQKTVKQAVAWAKENKDLVTLGIKPTRPETGYGYLKMGFAARSECLKVEKFVEKPNLEKARQFVESKNYLWNGGMFVWSAETILAAFDSSMPEMSKVWKESGGNVLTAYPKMTATSIDFGVMEKAENVVSFELDCGWDDVGSWTSLESLGVERNGECVEIESSGNIVDSSGQLVSLLGVQDLIVVATDGVVLVAHKSKAQDIKRMVDEVKKKRPDLV